jgi:tetratricopeptide (TPR) repeat protein
MLAQAYRVLANSASDDAQAHIAAECNFEKISVVTEAAARSAFAQGAAALLQKDWDAAIEAFSISMRCHALEADACMGMAQAWQGKGQVLKSREYLQRAAALYLRVRQWAEAQEAFTRLLADSPPNTPNPILPEAVELLRKGNIEQAAQALIAAHALPNTEAFNIHYIGRASQFSEQPEQSIRELCSSIRQSGAPDLSRRLEQRLTGTFGQTKKNDENTATEADLESSAAPRRFGLLHDVLSVARYTARRWSEVA